MQNWLDLTAEDAETFGTHEVALKHYFSESGLFTDEKLAELIERYPRAHYNCTTMNREGEERFWRDGDVGNASGMDVLKAIENGHLWINLRHLEINAPEIGDIITEALDQIRSMKPGFNYSRQNSGLLISSPSAKVHCHADVPMICLWHIRGRKRVWLWDPKDNRFLPNRLMEGIVLGETEADLPYTQEWDDHGTPYELSPGDAISWPLNAPHRVDNIEGLNVSLTTEFFTAQAKRQYGVHYANGVMRRSLGVTPRSAENDGLLAVAKCATALGIKKLGFRPEEKHEFVATFEVDPTAPDGVRLLKESERKMLELT